MALFLKILLGLLLAALLLLLLALLLPAAVSFSYRRGQLHLRLRVLFLSIPLTGTRAARRMQQAGERTLEETVPELSSILKNPGLLSKLLRPAGRLLSKLFRIIRIEDLYIFAAVTGRTPEQTGTLVGRAWSVFGAAAALLQNIVMVIFSGVTFLPDFTGEREGELELSGRVKAPPILIIAALAAFAARLRELRATGTQEQPKTNHAEEGARV